jgi:hypothetical protein
MAPALCVDRFRARFFPDRGRIALESLRKSDNLPFSS